VKKASLLDIFGKKHDDDDSDFFERYDMLHGLSYLDLSIGDILKFSKLLNQITDP